MNYDQMTISEMEEVYSRLGEEIDKRRRERRLEEVDRSNSTFH